MPIISASHKSTSFAWVRSLGRSWVLPLGSISLGLMIAGFCGAVAAHLLGARDIMGLIFASGIGLSLIAALVEHFAFYHGIRCPQCRHNPTRQTDGRTLPAKQVRQQLRGLTSCPACPDLAAIPATNLDKYQRPASAPTPATPADSTPEMARTAA